LGKALPVSRRAFSLARRWAIRAFSSWSVMVCLFGIQVARMQRSAIRGRVYMILDQAAWTESGYKVSQAALQAGLDELVEVTVKHRLGIAHLDARTQVLDT